MLAFDLEGSIVSAEATILPAQARKESRGAHQRTDFPETLDSELVNYRVKSDPGLTLTVERDEIPPLSEELEAIAASTTEIENFEGKLIE